VCENLCSHRSETTYVQKVLQVNNYKYDDNPKVSSSIGHIEERSHGGFVFERTKIIRTL